ncbi:MAG: YbhB/YbcL family Raf kinase inhibitor-like protein, partial [Methanosarcina sp.]
MNRKAGAVVLMFLFAGVLLISGCINNEQIEAPADEESYDTGKGDENMDIQIIKVFSSAFE